MGKVLGETDRLSGCLPSWTPLDVRFRNFTHKYEAAATHNGATKVVMELLYCKGGSAVGRWVFGIKYPGHIVV